nr:MAG TPA: hypothetical protein [Caudoviricetes sp.]
MFKDTQIEILDGSLKHIVNIDADVQPFDKTMQFEDNIEIEITQRAFCGIIPQIDDKSYLIINGKLYKIMKIKPYSDYLEFWLYECEREIV